MHIKHVGRSQSPESYNTYIILASEHHRINASFLLLFATKQLSLFKWTEIIILLKLTNRIQQLSLQNQEILEVRASQILCL